ncbi:Amino-acid permease inda1 [Pyrenophora tritici-repentis]|nr:Amino-acid permease inda1 [Pyrenophora tritici-repentis]
MPNHQLADEKPEAVPYGYEETNVGFEEPFVHGAATVGGETGRGGDTHRGLKSRHIQFLALGGAIGTGLFIGSGSILALVGPAPLFMAYLSMMLVVYSVMNNLAEIVTYLPMRGITIPYFVKRFVDPSLAFAVGWNYWYAYAILVAAEATAGAILLDYWETPVHNAVWITIFLVVVLFLNIVAVEVFGEAEFWFASIKFLTIIGLIILGLSKRSGRLGFRYWNKPGAFKPYIVEGNSGKFLAYWTAFVRAGFAFITSPELIALSAGETIAPRRNIPKAAGRFIYRLAIFYGLGSFIIGVIVPSDDPRLLSGSSNASASPFVIGIQRAGIAGLNHVVNAAVLTSAWSAGNAFLFSGSRVLYGMALNGEAPKIFGRTSKKGVPYVAVLATWAIGLLAYLNVSNTGARVFLWFSNISTISGFIAWIVVMITYIRFRKAMVFNNLLHTLPYRTPFQPYLTYFVLGIISLLTLTNGFQVFVPRNWSVSDFLAATAFAIKTEHIDVTTGVREMNELCKDDISSAPVAKNWAQKVWFWIA